MGVSGLVSWLKRRFPEIVVKDTGKKLQINNLLLDMNSILYSAAAQIKPETEEVAESFVDYVFNFIEGNFVVKYQPSDLIYLAFDGPPPNAKVDQQRKRRYVYVHDTQETGFSNLNFTPGTVFFDELNEMLKFKIECACSTEPAWSKCKVLYSSSYVPGEGEHKIMDYLRSMKSKEGFIPNQKYLIYSPDADVIFLCLSTHEPNFYIVRTDHATKQFELLSLLQLREGLLNSYHFYRGVDFERNIDDFVGFSVLLGNDFFPGLKDFTSRADAMESMLSSYKCTRQSLGTFLVNDGKIDPNFFKVFLQFLSAYYSDNDDLVYDEEEEEEAKEISTDTFDIINWVIQYYRSGVPSWTFLYPHFKGPTIKMLLENIPNEAPEFELGEPTPALMALLVVTPKSHSRLLPPKVAALMDLENLKEYFPSVYDVVGDMYTRVAIIPSPDINEIRKEFDKLNLSLDPLNRVEKLCVFEEGKFVPVDLPKGDPFPPIPPSIKIEVKKKNGPKLIVESSNGLKLEGWNKKAPINIEVKTQENEKLKVEKRVFTAERVSPKEGEQLPKIVIQKKR